MEATTAVPVPGRTGFSHRKLRELREAAGLSREQACVRLGISYPYLVALEGGDKQPSVRMVSRLAAGYGRHPGDLFCDEAGPAPAPMRLTAPLACPSCGHEFTGRWVEDHETAGQQCEACGHVFTATWPGFTFEPETVVVRPSVDGEHDAA